MEDVDFGEQIENSQAFREGLEGMSAHDYVDRIHESGLFDGFDGRKLHEREEAVREEFTTNPAYAFYELGATSFDKECIEGIGPGEPNSYYAIVQQLAGASHTLFEPDEVLDEVDFDEAHAKLSLKHEDEWYEREFEQEENFFSYQALELVNEALEASGCDERFIPLPNTEQDEKMSVIFTSRVTYDRAIGLGVIPNVVVYIEDDR